MPIKVAQNIDWDKHPRCPDCDRRIKPIGMAMPFVVLHGKVHCAHHGARRSVEYARRLKEYKAWRRARARAFKALRADAARPARIR